MASTTAQPGSDDRVVDEPVRLGGVSSHHPHKTQPTRTRSTSEVDRRGEHDRRTDRGVEPAGEFVLQRCAADLHGQQPAVAVPFLEVGVTDGLEDCRGFRRRLKRRIVTLPPDQ
jgi:hypothetical protein